MTAPRLTDLLYGESSEQVDRRTASLARATALGLGDPHLRALDFRVEDLKADTPLFLTPTTAPGLHLSGFLPQVYDAWLIAALKLDEQAFEQATVHASALYSDLLSTPWGLLCALGQDSFIWLKPGRNADEPLDPHRIETLRTACSAQADLLRHLDDRLTGRAGESWQDATVLAFLKHQKDKDT